MPSDDDDLFDDILNLEEQYHKEGYDEGYKDGAEAGRIEGRSVGMKKGFEKFLEAGRLQGKAIVWANRIPNLRKHSTLSNNSQEQTKPQASVKEPPSSSQGDKEQEPESESESEPKTLPPLNSNARLEKNVKMLYGLVEPGTLSTKNDDESVNDFDSRMKAAQGRLKMIERTIGEGTKKGSADRFRPNQPAQKNENIEDIGSIPRRPATEGQG